MSATWFSSLNLRVIFILVLLGLAACGGGGGGGGGPPSSGAAANSAVVGVDADSNGIRDEIDSFIATKYGADPNQAAAAQVSARAIQNILLADSTNANAALNAMINSADAGVCAGKKFLANGIAVPEKELAEIFLRSVNTPERIAQKNAVAAKAGQFTRSVTAVVCP